MRNTKKPQKKHALLKIKCQILSVNWQNNCARNKKGHTRKSVTLLFFPQGITYGG